jgi:hypothetical protein
MLNLYVLGFFLYIYNCDKLLPLLWKQALHIFLWRICCLHDHSLALGPLVSKIRIILIETLQYLISQSNNWDDCLGTSK